MRKNKVSKLTLVLFGSLFSFALSANPSDGVVEQESDAPAFLNFIQTPAGEGCTTFPHCDLAHLREHKTKNLLISIS